MRKAFRFRLYPTPEQEEALSRVAGCARLACNRAKAAAEAHRREKGETLSVYAIRKRLKEWKADLPFLREVPHHCLQEAVLDYGVARKRFFDGVSGAPDWRRKYEDDGFRFPDPGQFDLDVKAGLLVLPKFGKTKTDSGPIPIRLHREVKGRIRSVTIRREGGLWFASLSVAIRLREGRRRRPAPLSGPLTISGTDRNVGHPFVTATVSASGEEIVEFFGEPIESEADRRRERRLHKALSRKKKGSANRRKARIALARHKAKIARRRKDRTHKASRRTVDGADVIAIEALCVKNMTASARGTVDEPGRNVAQKAGLNRSILGVGWGEYRRQVIYKAGWAARRVVEVAPAYTSQECRGCGHVSPENRKGERFRCVSCGREAHADAQAAHTIRARALKALGLITFSAGGRPVAACGAFDASRAMKQEGGAVERLPKFLNERSGKAR